ncbi:hypothetical protein IH979_03355 [Patescibacteria group bacterium]|nr:hypothetical protein [Patescibacteria group bacterium]
MKKIIGIIILVLIIIGIVIIYIMKPTEEELERVEILQLEEELEGVQNIQEEKRILEELWLIIYNSEEVGMGISAKDSRGNNAFYNLNAVEPITVIITLRTTSWIKRIEFVPLDIENVYLFLLE